MLLDDVTFYRVKLALHFISDSGFISQTAATEHTQATESLLLPLRTDGI